MFPFGKNAVILNFVAYLLKNRENLYDGFPKI